MKIYFQESANGEELQYIPKEEVFSALKRGNIVCINLDEEANRKFENIKEKTSKSVKFSDFRNTKGNKNSYTEFIYIDPNNNLCKNFMIQDFADQTSLIVLGENKTFSKISIDKLKNITSEHLTLNLNEVTDESLKKPFDLKYDNTKREIFFVTNESYNFNEKMNNLKKIEKFLKSENVFETQYDTIGQGKGGTAFFSNKGLGVVSYSDENVEFVINNKGKYFSNLTANIKTPAGLKRLENTLKSKKTNYSNFFNYNIKIKIGENEITLNKENNFSKTTYNNKMTDYFEQELKKGIDRKYINFKKLNEILNKLDNDASLIYKDFEIPKLVKSAIISERDKIFKEIEKIKENKQDSSKQEEKIQPKEEPKKEEKENFSEIEKTIIGDGEDLFSFAFNNQENEKVPDDKNDKEKESKDNQINNSEDYDDFTKKAIDFFEAKEVEIVEDDKILEEEKQELNLLVPKNKKEECEKKMLEFAIKNRKYIPKDAKSDLEKQFTKFDYALLFSTLRRAFKENIKPKLSKEEQAFCEKAMKTNYTLEDMKKVFKEHKKLSGRGDGSAR